MVVCGEIADSVGYPGQNPVISLTGFSGAMSKKIISFVFL
jgi:hypothetical protein